MHRWPNQTVLTSLRCIHRPAWQTWRVKEECEKGSH